jgi:hypothetical protein
MECIRDTTSISYDCHPQINRQIISDKMNIDYFRHVILIR